jgi:hypothetical protein
MGETVVSLILAAIIAVLIGFLDQPLFGIQLAWWVCALIGLVVAFGGWFVLVVVDE